MGFFSSAIQYGYSTITTPAMAMTAKMTRAQQNSADGSTFFFVGHGVAIEDRQHQHRNGKQTPRRTAASRGEPPPRPRRSRLPFSSELNLAGAQPHVKERHGIQRQRGGRGRRQLS